MATVFNPYLHDKTAFQAFEDNLERLESAMYPVERWVSRLATPTGGRVTETGFSAFRVTSNANAGDFGTAVQILDVNDTPVIAGERDFQFGRILIAAAEANATYRIRFAWGGASYAAAVTSGRYLDIVLPLLSASPLVGPHLLLSPKIAVGVSAWAAVAKSSATAHYVDFLFSLVHR